MTDSSQNLVTATRFALATTGIALAISLSQCLKKDDIVIEDIGLRFAAQGEVTTDPKCYHQKRRLQPPSGASPESILIGIDIDENGSILQQKIDESYDSVVIKDFKYKLAADQRYEEPKPGTRKNRNEMIKDKVFSSTKLPTTSNPPILPIRVFRKKPEESDLPENDKGVRSPLSFETPRYSHISYILLDDNLYFPDPKKGPNVDLTSIPGNLYKTPIRVVDNNDKVLSMTFFAGVKNFPHDPATPCRYGLNIHVISAHEIDPDGSLSKTPPVRNGDEYNVETPLIIDPVVRNNGDVP